MPNTIEETLPPTQTVPATLLWSEPDGNGGYYLGVEESEATLTQAELWALVTQGRGDNRFVVTSVLVHVQPTGEPNANA